MWVAGISGSGKSAVRELLRAEGHPAIEADWDGYSRWVDRRTGEVAADAPYPTPPRWLDQFAWLLAGERVEALAAEAGSGVTFLCGYEENYVEVWHHFDGVVWLSIDDDTMRRRLSTRATNEFGKHPDELDAALRTNARATDDFTRLGATVVDAEPFVRTGRATLPMPRRP